MLKSIIAFAFTCLFSCSALAETGFRVSLQCSNSTGTLTYTEKNKLFGMPPMTGELLSEKVWKYGVAVEGNFLYRFVLLKQSNYQNQQSEKSSTLKAVFLEETPIFNDLKGKRVFAQRIKLNPGSGGWVLSQPSVTEYFMCTEHYAINMPS